MKSTQTTKTGKPILDALLNASESFADKTATACQKTPTCEHTTSRYVDQCDRCGQYVAPQLRKATQAQHSPLPWTLQNGAIYDASDNGRVQNVRLCKLVVSSTAIEPADAALIVASVNNATALAEALRKIMQDYSDNSNVDIGHNRQIAREALARWEAK